MQAGFALHGSKRWLDQISFPGQDEIQYVAVDPSDNVFAFGTVGTDTSGTTNLFVRKYNGATGMPIKHEMEEALRRLESGEDPDKIEEEMGDVLEQDPFGEGNAPPAEGASAKGGRSLRRILPPSVDPQLYEM